MLLAVFGVPTATASVGARIVHSVVRCAAGPTDLVSCRSLDELREAWASRAEQNILYYNESPSGEISRFFREVSTPLLLFVDDPVEVGVSLHSERAVEVLQAVRVSSLCTVSLNELLLANDVLKINSSRHSSMSLGELISSIASFYRFPGHQALVEAVIADVSNSLGLECPVPASSAWCELAKCMRPPTQVGMSVAEFDLLETMLCCYRDPTVLHLKWAPGLFMTAENVALNDTFLDLTGPSRLFIHGPYMGLPRGSWVARIEFEARSNLFGFELLVHVVADGYLKKGRMSVPQDGRYVTEIRFVGDDPSVPVQLQILLERGAIGGEFRLMSVELQRDR